MNEEVLEQKEKFFWLVNGKGLRSLRELADALPTISEDEFSHHVTADKNDFADWIRVLFGENQLAEFLRKTKTRAEFQSVLYNQFARKDIFKRKERTKKEVEKPEMSVVEKKTKPVIEPATESVTESVIEPATESVTESDIKPDTEPALNNETDVINNPDDFIKYHEEDAELKDKMAERFDAVATKFEESLHPETPRHVEKRIEDLEERYKELHSRIADARKLGKDPLIADFTLRPVMSKLAYARVTHQENDFLVVERIFTEAEKELAEALAFEEPDVKKEVDELVQEEKRPIAIEQTTNPETGGNS